MNKLFFTMLFIISLTINAQDKIKFKYDTAGNQIQREWCSSCFEWITSAKKATIQENKPLNDMISYYPNPVKEELFMKWELVDEKTVSSISVFNITGALLKVIKNIDKETNQNISFEGYPQGTYLIELKYSNGEKKSIKIIKNQD